nr:1-phosphofructokinase [Mammaliicoccus sp. Marseille-Q6498]
MIYTVTFNPSIDYVMFTEQFQVGELNRAHKTNKFPGGKGINVSRVLTTLNVENTATGFVGGFPGEFIKDELKKSNILTDFVEVDDDTRINVKLKSGSETEINGPGPSIEESHYKQFLSKMNNTNSKDTVIIAGSVPSTLKVPVYQEVAEILKTTGATLIVDAEKDLMKSILSYKPKFVKPNKTELEEIFDKQIETDQEVIECAKQLMDEGAQSVIVSLGGEGAIYVDSNIQLKAIVPNGEVVNTVGSGDSTVAGMVAGLETGKDIEEAFKLAVSCGTATAFNADLAEYDDIEDIISKVTIKHL